MTPLAGIFRYARHDDLLGWLALGWRWAGDLGPVHGLWSSLIWWCCGDCRDCEREPPK